MSSIESQHNNEISVHGGIQLLLSTGFHACCFPWDMYELTVLHYAIIDNTLTATNWRNLWILSKQYLTAILWLFLKQAKSHTFFKEVKYLHILIFINADFWINSPIDIWISSRLILLPVERSNKNNWLRIPCRCLKLRKQTSFPVSSHHHKSRTTQDDALATF